jgi:acyl dehydratase
VTLYFEDFEAGQELELGERTLSQDEIVAFGRHWDPLEFHVNPAVEDPYGGLIASGRHSCLVWQRLFVDSVLGRTAGLGSPGLDEIRWLVPVRPGERLRGRLRVTEIREHADRGDVRFDGELVNQADEVAVTVRGWVSLERA